MKYTASALGVLLALNVAEIQAGTMGPVQMLATEKVYFGVFGGGGSSNHVKIKQYGTAFFFEEFGGALAVNAFGHLEKRYVGMVGGHVGFSWQDIFLNSANHPVSLSPAVELEGYYLGKSSLK